MELTQCTDTDGFIPDLEQYHEVFKRISKEDDIKERQKISKQITRNAALLKLSLPKSRKQFYGVDRFH